MFTMTLTRLLLQSFKDLSISSQVQVSWVVLVQDRTSQCDFTLSNKFRRLS